MSDRPDSPPAETRDLLITSHTPALGSGRALRTYAIARALASHRPLDLLYVRFGADRPDSAFSSIPDIQMHEIRPSRDIGRLLAFMRARFVDRAPSDLARGASEDLRKAARDLASAPRRARVIADGPTVAAALMSLARARPVIYNAHNLESGFRHELDSEDSTALLGRLRRRKLRAFETRVLDRFAECWMVSDADIAGAKALCAHARLRYAPNVIDVAAIVPADAANGAQLPEARAQRAIFVGSFDYEPNRRALRFLIDEVMPLVWASLPEATLAVVGRGLPEPPTSDGRVETLGFVEDIGSAYAEAGCAVVPLLQGGGSPLKLVEALAHRLPVVATSRAVAGLRIRAGGHCLVADGAEAFADAMLQVMRGQAPSSMASRGCRLAQESYSIEALASLLRP